MPKHSIGDISKRVELLEKGLANAKSTAIAALVVGAVALAGLGLVITL